MRRLFPLFALFLALSARAEINPEWTTSLPPFQIADNLYYVGSQELAAYLVTTPAGNILLNANLETSPPQIRASVEKLGFQWADTKILLNTATLYSFWETMLLGTGTYRGAPFPKHAVLPVEKAHFDRWLELFLATVDENFSGPKADEAKGRALSIADTFARRMGVLPQGAVLLQP